LPLNSTITLGNGNWTISAWVKTLSGGTVISNDNGGPVTNELGITSSKILYSNYNGSWQIHYGVTNVTDDTWHYLTWVNFDNHTMKMYVDGNLDVASFDSTTNNGGPVNAIGRSWYRSFSGTLDDVKIWKHALSAREINASYNVSSYRLENNFTGLSDGVYTFNAHVQDLSGNVNSAGIQTIIVDTITPTITYVAPTDSNNTNVARNYTYINVTTSDTNQGSSFIDWNRSLVGWWRLEGNALDSSTYGNNGTAYFDTGSYWTSGGKLGQGIRFVSGDGGAAGLTDVVVVPDRDSLDLDLSKNFTIETWFKPATYSCTAILRKDSQFELYRCAGAGSGITIRLWNPGTVDNTGSIAISDGSWAHIVVTYDKPNTALKMYVNGAEAGSWSISGTPAATTGDVGLGAYPSGQFSINGTLDDVKFYSRAISIKEINASYNAGSYRLENNFTNLATGTYTYKAYTQDLAGNTNSEQERTFIVNSAPVMNSSTIAPSTAYVNDTLKGYCSANDSDGGNVSYYYQWYVGTVANASGITSRNFTQSTAVNVANISSSNLVKSQSWILGCRAFDGYSNSTLWKNSTARTIDNSAPPKVNLSYPLNNDTSFINRTPRFNWSAVTDANGDSVTYNIAVSTFNNFSDIIYNVSGISNNYYDSSSELQFITYYWKVKANDGALDGNWSDTWNFTVVSYVSVQMINANISFDSVNPSESQDTTDDAPAPFLLKSFSNTYIDARNLTVANSLWATQPLDTRYWQMKTRLKTDGSFNSTGSLTTFFNITNVSYLVRRLNYSQTRNNVTFDINITVPMYEHPGVKSSWFNIDWEVAS